MKIVLLLIATKILPAITNVAQYRRNPSIQYFINKYAPATPTMVDDTAVKVILNHCSRCLGVKNLNARCISALKPCCPFKRNVSKKIPKPKQ